jgi:hypothetical protein
MYEIDLKEGLVCYWQDGGWHGCHQIIKWNERFVYYIDFHDNEKKKEIKQLYKTGLKKFLESHSIYKHTCEYGNFHKNIGNIIQLNHKQFKKEVL